MQKVLNNVNPQQFANKFIPKRKLVNYLRSSGKHPAHIMWPQCTMLFYFMQEFRFCWQCWSFRLVLKQKLTLAVLMNKWLSCMYKGINEFSMAALNFKQDTDVCILKYTGVWKLMPMDYAMRLLAEHWNNRI